MKIRILQPEDIDSFAEHFARHMAESGRGNTPFFAPHSSSELWDKQSRRSVILERWSKPLTQVAWGRAWGAYDSDRMIGHVDLKARPIVTSLHRAIVGIGIEETYRKMGLGRRLMETALEWAKEQLQLSWLDLNVFANNEAGIRLYSRCGFVEAGRTKDLFRVDGISVDDIQMVLRLRPVV